MDQQLRYQIALAVSQANQSDYCLAAYTALGKAAGLREEAATDARAASSPNSRTDAALKFVSALEQRPTQTPERELAKLRSVGFSSAEIAEIIANAVLVSLGNYLCHVADMTLDFPAVDPADNDLG